LNALIFAKLVKKNGKMSEVQAEKLTKKFGNFIAVNQISFNVNKGEVFGFLGPNGAGKTTTISMLCTLMQPTSGKATVSGYDVIKQANDVR
jgi:ABC-2 type transport system ATP-binding protein